eukprot:6198060-Pleurochrysis_carterae.AAC.4
MPCACSRAVLLRQRSPAPGTGQRCTRACAAWHSLPRAPRRQPPPARARDAEAAPPPSPPRRATAAALACAARAPPLSRPSGPRSARCRRVLRAARNPLAPTAPCDPPLPSLESVPPRAPLPLLLPRALGALRHYMRLGAAPRPPPAAPSTLRLAAGGAQLAHAATAPVSTGALHAAAFLPAPAAPTPAPAPVLSPSSAPSVPDDLALHALARAATTFAGRASRSIGSAGNMRQRTSFASTAANADACALCEA